MGLPYHRPFMAKLHYIEFWVTSYNMGGWPLKQFFLKTFAMESKTFYGFLISYIVPTMVGEWVFHITVILWIKWHYIEYWVTSYTRAGWQLKQFFLNTFAMERRTFYGFLISYKVSTMVGEWVYHIAVLFWQNCITLDFG